MMEAIHYSETSLLTRATRRNIPEDGIFHQLSQQNNLQALSDSGIQHFKHRTICRKIRKNRAEGRLSRTKQTLWTLVREQTIPTERPSLVDEI
jgi:hypothetical protein